MQAKAKHTKKKADFKANTTKVGQYRVQLNLIHLDFKKKVLNTRNEQTTGESVVKQLRSQVVKTRRDALREIEKTLDANPGYLLPVHANSLVNALFRCLHDDDYMVFKGAAHVLNKIADTNLDTLVQYQQLFYVNLKLILNQSFMDNRRAFLEELGDNLIKLISPQHINDFSLCLQDEFIAIKAVYVVIQILTNDSLLSSSGTQFAWEYQHSLIGLQVGEFCSQGSEFVEQLIILFKQINISHPIKASTDTSYLQSLLLLIFYLQRSNFIFPESFYDYLKEQFPYYYAQEDFGSKEACFVLNSFVFLVTGIEKFHFRDLQRGATFNIAHIMGIAKERQDFEAVQYLADTQAVKGYMSTNALKCLLKHDFQVFKQFFPALSAEDRVEVLFEAYYADFAYVVAELSKLLLKKDYDRAELLAKISLQRNHELAVYGFSSYFRSAGVLERFSRVVIKGKIYSPAEVMRTECAPALTQRFFYELKSAGVLE